jgi:hypothetical protein
VFKSVLVLHRSSNHIIVRTILLLLLLQAIQVDVAVGQSAKPFPVEPQ